MLFNSLQFLIFFPVVTALYFLLPHRQRWLMLLIASCVFYMVFIPAYILILFVLIIIDYFAAICIENTQDKSDKRKFLMVSVLATCFTLFIFKYYNFFNTNLAAIARFLHWNYSVKILNIILPIGLSFHTFQSLSYVIEVYKGRQRAERNFGIYSLYVMFYPQLVAGPIERPGNLLHQFYEEHGFEYKRVTDGLKLMAWGMFKKVVIADRLALYVNAVYNNPTGYDGVVFIVATVFFAYQIYCDFSGYTDIAIGAAQVMGFRLMDNFNRPYFSKSVSEFWRRWNISLSSWFRDYLYFPLGGNRVLRWRWYYNILITFLVSGLWHGANWTYIIWGALNGVYIICGNASYGIRKRMVEISGLNKAPQIHKYLKVLFMFSLICFAWIFFRANTTQDAFYIISHLLVGVGPFLASLAHITSPSQLKNVFMPLWIGQPSSEFFIAIAAIIFLESIHSIQRHKTIRHMFAEKPWYIRWAAYYGIILSMLYFGVFNDSPFIYFQF